MTPTPALQRFVDDEMLRVPLVLEHTLQAVMDGLQKGHSALAPGERRVVGDLLLRLGSHRRRVVDRFVASLSEQVKAEIQRTTPLVATAAPLPRGMLSLVDDDEVAIDVAISHTIEAIKSVAEQELRELLTYTSALAGDMDVAGDHNPFRAEMQARALWAGVQAVPLSRGHQLALMRHAAMPLAQSLRKAYVATCSRLEAAGVVPAAYRTVIPPAGPRSAKLAPPPPDLQRILASMPARAAAASAPKLSRDLETMLRQADKEWRQLPAETAAAEQVRVRDSQRTQLAQTTSNAVDRQVMELLSRLFDALLTDTRLPVELHGPMSRLQGFALRVVLRDATALDALDHPLWHFMNLLAHEAVVYPGVAGEQRALLVQVATGLIDKIADETTHTAQLYRWAHDSLVGYARNRLAQRCAAAAEEIGTMQALEDRLAQPGGQPSTFHGALDATQLDTVPADLLDTLHASDKPDAISAARWVGQRHAGDWLRVFRKGGWVNAQLLWPGERGEIWLFANGDAEATWAIRRSALLLLHDEGLLDLITPRSLMHDAAERLVRRLSRDKAA